MNQMTDLQLPSNLRERAEKAAERDGASLPEFICEAVRCHCRRIEAALPETELEKAESDFERDGWTVRGMKRLIDAGVDLNTLVTRFSEHCWKERDEVRFLKFLKVFIDAEIDLAEFTKRNPSWYPAETYGDLLMHAAENINYGKVAFKKAVDFLSEAGAEPDAKERFERAEVSKQFADAGKRQIGS